MPTSHDPADYARVLLDLGCEVDAWETTYLHVLTGPDPVFDWVSGTGARPTLQALPDDLRPLFEDEFRALLREAYPADASGRVILPFRRIFVVARKPPSRSRLMRLHHVQVACPPGGEDAARRFYADGLGMTEVDKPADLVAAAAAGSGRTTTRVRSRPSCTSASRTRSPRAQGAPGLRRRRPRRGRRPAPGLGFEVDESQRDTFPGHVRFHAFDGHGNRVEVLARTADPGRDGT